MNLQIGIEQLKQDLRYGWRSLRTSPGFTAVAVLTLMLGIGANTAIFTVVNAILLQPLPYPDSERIMMVNTQRKKSEPAFPRTTGGDIEDIRNATDIFEATSYYQGGETGVQLPHGAEFTPTYLVNAGFFSVFKMTPVVGRIFTDDEAERAAVISTRLAKNNFGSAQAALGQRIRVEGTSYEIVGVLDKGYAPTVNVWLAGPYKPSNVNRTGYNYKFVARLRPGVSIESAQAKLNVLAARLQKAYPDTNGEKTFSLVPLHQQIVGKITATLFLLAGAVGLVLLLACVNVANLMLARSTARGKEFAVRLALGASRWRLVTQLLVESALLATIAGVCSLLLAQLAVRTLIHFAPQDIPRLQEVHISGTVLVFTMLACLISTLAFGLLPALQSSRVNVNEALKSGGSRGVLEGGRSPLRKVLMVTEIAMSFVLALGAGLLFRSFVQLTNVDLGFRSKGVLVMESQAPARGEKQSIEASQVFARMIPELAAIPGVESATAAQGLPTGAMGSNGSYAVRGKQEFRAGVDMPEAGFTLAAPGYFHTMGVPLLKGRDFSPQDKYDSQFVTIISQALAKQSFPNEDPIGKQIQCGYDAPDKLMTVVGVVADIRQAPDTPPRPELYMPAAQHPLPATALQVVLATSVPPETLEETVRQKVRAANPEIAIKFTTMQAMINESVATPRFRTFLLSLFAGLAVSMALLGIYGVLSYITARRTAEMGLRIAFGAAKSDLMTLILNGALQLAVVGIAIGLVLYAAASRLLKSMLFGVSSFDPMAVTATCALLMLVAVGAALIPARRAASVDPMVALRNE